MRSPLFFLSAAACALASGSLLAQTSATQHRTTTTGAAAHKPAQKPGTATHTAAPGCAAVPTLSPKIPALPAGVGCAKVLYTITSSATQLSPMLSPALKENLQN